MAVIAVLHHLEQPFLGHVDGPLREAGHELDERFIRRGDPPPDLAGVGGIVALGGEQSLVGAGADGPLGAVAQTLRDAVAAGVPVLGICLGGQLLARALGGRVRHVGRRIEWAELVRTPAGAADPLFAGLPEPIPALHFNEDVFEPPPGAEVLAGPAPAGAAAFRAPGRVPAWGLQYHPDADGPAIEGWIAEHATEIGDVDAFRAATAERLAVQARASAILFGAFARQVAAAGR